MEDSGEQRGATGGGLHPLGQGLENWKKMTYKDVGKAYVNHPKIFHRFMGGVVYDCFTNIIEVY